MKKLVAGVIFLLLLAPLSPAVSQDNEQANEKTKIEDLLFGSTGGSFLGVLLGPFAGFLLAGVIGALPMGLLGGGLGVCFGTAAGPLLAIVLGCINGGLIGLLLAGVIGGIAGIVGGGVPIVGACCGECIAPLIAGVAIIALLLWVGIPTHWPLVAFVLIAVQVITILLILSMIVLAMGGVAVGVISGLIVIGLSFLIGGIPISLVGGLVGSAIGLLLLGLPLTAIATAVLGFSLIMPCLFLGVVMGAFVLGLPGAAIGLIVGPMAGYVMGGPALLESVIPMGISGLFEELLLVFTGLVGDIPTVVDNILTGGLHYLLQYLMPTITDVPTNLTKILGKLLILPSDAMAIVKGITLPKPSIDLPETQKPKQPEFPKLEE